MAPQQQRTWRAWFTDSDGRRVERTGEGDMPADIQEQLRQANAPAAPASANTNAPASGPSGAGSSGSPSPAPVNAPAPVPTTPPAPTPAPAPVATAATPAQPAPAPVAAPTTATPPATPSPSSTPSTPTPPANNAAQNAVPHAPGVASAAATSGAPQSVGNGNAGSAAASGSPAMVALGVGLIAILTICAIGAVLFYRRRLKRREAATMFLDVNEKDLPRATGGVSIRGKKISDPTLVDTTAGEALRGPGVVPAGPKGSRGSTATPPKGKRAKPKLSLSNYRTNMPAVPPVAVPSPSPRTSGYDFGVAPSPRRQTSFDCAPSPLPTDGRQRHSRYDYDAYDDATSFAQPNPVRRSVTVGHRRTSSRTSTTGSIRMAMYGQNGMSRMSSGDNSLLSIPMASRYSFNGERNGDTREVQGMI